MNDQVSLEWFAGFYEGEGDPAHSRLTLGLRITQKDRRVLNSIQRTFGGGVHTYNSYHRWELGGVRAVTLAKEMLVHMHHPEKIEQLTRALILTGHTEPRSDAERLEFEAKRKRVRAVDTEKHKKYDTKRYAEEKLVRQYLRAHPEAAEKLPKRSTRA